MQMVPVKELKDSARISRLCHGSGEPVHVTKNGYADTVIMSAEVFEEMGAQARAGRTVAPVQEGIDMIARGECRDAFEAVSSLRGKYGL